MASTEVLLFELLHFLTEWFHLLIVNADEVKLPLSSQLDIDCLSTVVGHVFEFDGKLPLCKFNTVRLSPVSDFNNEVLLAVVILVEDRTIVVILSWEPLDEMYALGVRLIPA